MRSFVARLALSIAVPACASAKPAPTVVETANADDCNADGDGCVCADSDWAGVCHTGDQKPGLYCQCEDGSNFSEEADPREPLLLAPPDPNAPKGPSVYSIDFGPASTAGIDVAALPVVKGPAKALKGMCDELMADAGGYLGDEGKCAVRALPVPAVGAITKVGLVAWLLTGDIPAPTERLSIALQTKAGWKKMQLVGTGEVGMMGLRTFDTIDIIAVGGHDFGAQGGWVWIDAVQFTSSYEAEAVGVRTLWLCGGKDVVACHAVPISAYDKPRGEDGELADEYDVDFPDYSFKASIGADGTLYMATQYQGLSAENVPLTGTRRLDALN